MGNKLEILQLLENGSITDFQGGYQEFQEARARRRQAEAALREKEKKEKTGEPAPRPGKKPETVPSREQEKRRRERARRIAAIEERLQELEQEMAECEGGDYVKLGELYHSRETLEEELLTLYEQQEAEG